MALILPLLLYEDLLPTRDALRDTAIIISNLQRLYIPKHPRQWEYGLNINLRGIVSQDLSIDQETIHASIDFVTHKLRLGSTNWLLNEYSPPELFSNVRIWLDAHKQSSKLDSVKFDKGAYQYDLVQAKYYAQALWWMKEQFDSISDSITEGSKSPVYLYAHHFDLSFAWFPYDDDRQIALGFSTGDEHIAEPYLYLTQYPQSPEFHGIKPLKESKWFDRGFDGHIILYSELQKSKKPKKIIAQYGEMMKDSRSLFN